MRKSLGACRLIMVKNAFGAFRSFCDTSSIRQEFTTPYQPSHNGVAKKDEYKNTGKSYIYAS